MPDVTNPVGRGPATVQTVNTQSPQVAPGFAQGGGGSYIFGQAGIAFVMPASGTISAAGVISGMGVALQATYANAYFYLPAGAVGPSSIAGWRFAQMTSTATGLLFLNQYFTGNPSVPSVLTPVTAGAGAYTQVSTAQLAQNIDLPGSSL